jgi:hypothetical protein
LLAASPTIEHEPLRCWTSDKFPVVSATVSDARTVKVYYRAVEYPSFFFDDGRREANGAFAAIMPMASPQTKDVVYFVEALNDAYQVSRTREYTVPVKESRDCSESEHGQWFEGDDPKIVARAVDPAGPRLPPGFQTAGLVGSGNSKPLLFGLLGAAAAGGVILANGAGSDDRVVSAGAPVGDPGPVSGNTTSVPVTTTAGTGSNTSTTVLGSPTAPGTTTVPGTSTTPPGTTTVPVTTTSPTTTSATPPRADLGISFSSNPPGSSAIGTVLPYRVSVTNGGPDTATGVTATMSFSMAVALNSAPGMCSGLLGSEMVCTIGTMAPGASQAVDFRVIGLIPGNLVVDAEVSGDQQDPNSSNNHDSVSTSVTTLLRTLGTSQVTIRSELVTEGMDRGREQSLQGLVRAGDQLYEISSEGARVLTFPPWDGGWIEAEVRGNPRAKGLWRFELSSESGNLRFEVDAGVPASVEGRAIVFHVEGSTRIRFRPIRRGEE